MKYEYLCGHVSDFFAMPENVIAVVQLDHCVQGLTEFNQITECGKPVLAMRRIIAEPKRWTVADQQAGRDPKVGCMVMVTSVDECASVAAINNDAVCVVFHDGEFTTLHKSGISPIETPEEKAQREEDEFVMSIMLTPVHSGTSDDYFMQGARAAYRKLKGGE